MVKNLVSITLFFLLYSSYPVFCNPCSDGISDIEDAYYYAMKAYNSTNIEDLRYYIDEAKDSAEDAIDAFNNCECSDAVSYSEDCYSYCEKAYNESDFENAKYYVWEAMCAAEDAKDEAEDCY